MVLEEAFRAEKETENPALQFFGVAYSDLTLLLRWLSSYSPTLNMTRNMGACVGCCQHLLGEGWGGGKGMSCRPIRNCDRFPPNRRCCLTKFG
jgi:hypothetical protein